MPFARVMALSVFLAFAGICPAYAQKKAPDGAKVLMLSGGARQHHGYRDQAFYLANLLEDTGRFQVTIAEDAEILVTPALGKYDALIMMTDRRDPEFKLTLPQQHALLDYVKAGHGYVSLHGGDNAAPDWVPEWREMLGGVFSHDTQGGKYPDSKTRKGQYRIKIANPDHPVTKGLTDFDLSDELYYKLQLVPGGIQPLATTEFEGQAWPVAWVREYGKGRVFHTPLGHRDFGPGKADPLHTPEFARLLVQGLTWTVDSLPKPTAAR
ncbi:ThuA domain-containing protein [Isosphaeraceae bacterium EP7]